MKSILRTGLIGLAALSCLGAPATAQTPPQPAPLDAKLLAECGADGGGAAECRCGLGVARETLTQRELGLFPVLWPIVRQKGDVFTKITLGRAAAMSAGYSEQEAMQTVLKVAQAAPNVEKKCKTPTAP